MHDGRRRRRGGAALVGGGDVLVVLLPERPHLRADHQVVDKRGSKKRRDDRRAIPLLRDNRQPLRVPRLAAERARRGRVLRQVRGHARAPARHALRSAGVDADDAVATTAAMASRSRSSACGFPRHRAGERETLRRSCADLVELPDARASRRARCATKDAGRSEARVASNACVASRAAIVSVARDATKLRELCGQTVRRFRRTRRRARNGSASKETSSVSLSAFDQPFKSTPSARSDAASATSTA